MASYILTSADEAILENVATVALELLGPVYAGRVRSIRRRGELQTQEHSLLAEIEQNMLTPTPDVAKLLHELRGRAGAL